MGFASCSPPATLDACFGHGRRRTAYERDPDGKARSGRRVSNPRPSAWEMQEGCRGVVPRPREPVLTGCEIGRMVSSGVEEVHTSVHTPGPQTAGSPKSCWNQPSSAACTVLASSRSTGL